MNNKQTGRSRSWRRALGVGVFGAAALAVSLFAAQPAHADHFFGGVVLGYPAYPAPPPVYGYYPGGYYPGYYPPAYYNYYPPVRFYGGYTFGGGYHGGYHGGGYHGGGNCGHGGYHGNGHGHWGHH